MKQYICKFTLAIAIALSMNNFYCIAMEEKIPSEVQSLRTICTLPLEMAFKICSFLSSPEDLGSMSKTSKGWNEVLKSIYCNSKSTFIIGGSGSGVSTLACILAGMKMNVRKDYGKYVIECSEDNGGINISHDVAGSSKHRCIYAENIGKIWDCASFGFFAHEVDFSNAQHLQRLLAAPVKVIIAIEEPYSLFNRLGVGGPMAVLNRVAEMFSDLEQLKKIVSLVITKSRGEFTYTEMLEAFLKIKENYPCEYTKNFGELLSYF